MNEKIARVGSLIVTITVAVFAVCMLIDFSKGGLIFNYDLLGYGFMALSTFFTGLTIEGRSKADKVLKWLMLIHGIYEDHQGLIACACFVGFCSAYFLIQNISKILKEK